MHKSKLDICKETRKIASQTFFKSLSSLLKTNKPISETMLRDTWLEELRKNLDILPEGWYIPPPHGIGILFGSIKNPYRINYESLRPEYFWPQESVYLDKTDGIIYAYAGIVDKKSGIIGDFGLTLYLGKDKEYQTHLKTNISIIQDIFSYIHVGQSLSDIAHFTNKSLTKRGFVNTILSITDPTSVNIGHTIPFSYEEMAKKEKVVLHNAKNNWNEFCAMTSKKRIFINNSEKFIIKPNMALTIEPRLKITKKPYIPLGAYHTIVLIKENDKKELLTNFNDLFNLTGMTYMQN